MTPADLATVIRDCVATAVAAGDFAGDAPADVVVERPKNPEHGDYATNVALRLAKPAGRPAREVAELVAARLRALDGIDRVDVAGPGFLNITLATGTLGGVAGEIVEAGASFGIAGVLVGQKLNLEFVSANPTGPVHIGAVRWAAVGDALARILQAAGADVTREYYFNDAGSQIERFARTLREVAHGRPVPEDGYAGTYIDEISAAIVTANPGLLERLEDDQTEVFRREGVELMFAEIKGSLASFGVHFDVYFNERDLHDQHKLEAAIKRLRDQGNVFESEGATWLRTTDYGDDRDRVLARSNGELTYFAADCAYYLDKRDRGFDRAVIMLGADHHGYIGRLRAMATCFGDDPDQTLEILIGQLVNLVRDGEPLRMSKRAGTVIVLADLVDAIGADAARYALVRYSSDQSIDIDLDAWARKTNDNPVYYVQYAHARTRNVARNAESFGITVADALQPELLDHAADAALLTALGEFPRVVATAAELRAPHRIAHYLENLASTYHRWYDTDECRVTPKGDAEVNDGNRARVWLNEATHVVLANGLRLLGVSAPDRM
ncbi:MAG TPA: arginine--tRNA ligase [Jatrophihabitans sp.]|uniref:arginine--tRNA ligase n=1 Tax=Jatrophihabitans sp. TaxID=1932789 RepID=UPI002E011656|nr:arginine--tRNA ligase [Jatrophihabitans sp.]